MTITTTYKKLKSVYFLSGVQVEYSYKEEGKEVKGTLDRVFYPCKQNFSYSY